MTHRPIGSMWKQRDGSYWIVRDHRPTGEHFCECVQKSVKWPVGYKTYWYMKNFNIKDGFWTLVSTPSEKPFTDSEYEELLV